MPKDSSHQSSAAPLLKRLISAAARKLNAGAPISFLLVSQKETAPDQQTLAESLLAEPENEGLVFAVDLSSSTSFPPGVRPFIPHNKTVSLLRRLAFFSEPYDLPFLSVPVVLRDIWTDNQAASTVIAYPGVAAERLYLAKRMLEQGCEAVLLRQDDGPATVIALARNRRNERLLAHWVDLLDQFSSASDPQASFDLALPAQMIEFLCDRVGSIRANHRQRISYSPACLPSGTKITQLIRDAVRHILPECPELAEDPFEHALRCLNMASPAVPQTPGNLITRLMHFLWSIRPDLQSAFHLTTSEGQHAFVDWCFSRAPIEFDLADEFLTPAHKERENPSSARQNSEQELATMPAALPARDPQAGVNLIGYARAEMGLGEQMRQCAAALSAANIPYVIRDFPFGLIASQHDTRFQQAICTDQPFQINLFHINAAQMTLVRQQLGLNFFRNHYNIGYWAWELSNFPDEWQDAIDLMDEIWAVSKFTQAAIAPKTSKPVIWMPEAVEFPLPTNITAPSLIRQKFGLPESAYLFLFAFDFSSSASRKNATGCIHAFQKAFAESKEAVGLVIKTIRHPHHKREFWNLLRAIGEDDRIFLIDCVLRKDELHELISACDAFVSLHRSEGFGLSIAEAMYLGKPVIVTNYSGNTDFTTKENSCLVSYRLIPVNPGEYVLPEGQVWADPDLDEAAAYMQRLFSDREYGRQIGAAAASYMRRYHSHEAIGRRYAKRLQQIVAARNLLASPPE